MIVSEWLGGFGIDEGMLGPVIAARDRWLKPGGVMIPRVVTAWTALVHDRYSGEMVQFLRDNPYDLKLDDLAEMTVNEIFYSGTFRHLTAGDRRSEPGRLWTTDAEPDLARAGAGASPSRDAAACPRTRNGQRARTMVQRRTRARHLAVGGTRRSTDALGDDHGPAAPPRAAQTRHGRPRQSQDHPSPAGRDMDELGRRAAGRRLGGARRAGCLAGDRLTNPKNPQGARAGARADRPVITPPGPLGSSELVYGRGLQVTRRWRAVWARVGGGLPISSMRPSATSSRTAITMVTTAVGRPRKTKITAALEPNWTTAPELRMRRASGAGKAEITRYR